MPIPLETAENTFSALPRMLPPRFRRRGKRRYVLPGELGELAELAGCGNRSGVSAAMQEVFLEPQNPFDVQAKRKPRREVAFAGGLLLLGLVVFIVSSIAAQ
jgi:hypothetical protein